MSEPSTKPATKNLKKKLKVKNKIEMKKSTEKKAENQEAIYRSLKQKIEMDSTPTGNTTLSDDMANEAPPSDPLFTDESDTESVRESTRDFPVRTGQNEKIELFSNNSAKNTETTKTNKKNPKTKTTEKMEKEKSQKQKSLKTKSPKYNNTMTCIICHTKTTLPNFCDRCINAGFKEKHDEDPDSVHMGLWVQHEGGKYEFLPHKKRKNPINKISGNTSAMDNLYKFHLVAGKKDPTSQWSGSRKPGQKGRNWSKGYKANDANNVGIPCGKINGIIAIDLDFQTIKDEAGKKVGIDDYWHSNTDIPFHQAFGLPFNAEGETEAERNKGYIKDWDTLTQMTANGGIHMIFKYDPEVASSHRHPTIDIQSDGYYIVGHGSKVKNFHGEMIEYKIINNATIKPMPDELRAWVLDNCYTKEQKTKAKKRKERIEDKEKDPNYYKYIMSDEEADKLSADLIKADGEYITDTSKWAKYTTAMKVLGKKSIWDKYSKTGEKYDEERNEQFWNWSDDQGWANMLIHILNVATKTDDAWKGAINLIKMKTIYNKELNYDTTISATDGKYLGLAIERGVWALEGENDYLIHSSTGTGKTTLIKEEYMKKKSKFISITSRKTLAYEQYQVFLKHGIKKMIYYGNYLECPPQDFPTNKNVCIQLDSIGKLYQYMDKLGEYEIFLDEYSSLIEYLITSDTLKGKRIQIFTRLMMILRKAKRVIGADADITSYTMRFMNYCRAHTNRPLKLIKNEFEMARGRPAIEHFDLTGFKEELLKEDKYLLATDTKTNALAVFHTWHELTELPLNEDEQYEVGGKMYPKYELLMGRDSKGVVVCLTSDNDGMIDLDDFDRVIYSPKIIYGLDSTMRRKVFTMYEERTINPRAMLQQVARCRDPIELRFIFLRKQFKMPVYVDYKETEGDLLKVENIYDWELLTEQPIINLYKDILKYIMYNDDAYLTNPYLHFIQMVKQRGWNLQTAPGKTSKKGVIQMAKDYKELELGELFDKEHPAIKERNNYIKVPEEVLDDPEGLNEHQKLILTRNPNYEYYMTFKYYCFKTDEQLHSEVDIQEDFTMSRMRQMRGKIILLKNILELCGCAGKFDITATRGVPEARKDLLLKAIINQARMRFDKRKFDLSKKEDAQQLIFKLFKQTLGPTSVKSKRMMVDGERQQVYSISEAWKESLYEMCKYNMRVKDYEDYDDAIGKENENILVEEFMGDDSEEEDYDDL